MRIGHHKLLNQIDFDGSAADADAQPVTQDAWAYVTERICAATDPADPPDAVLLSLHGTLVTETDDDGEGALLAMLRARLGRDCRSASRLI